MTASVHESIGSLEAAMEQEIENLIHASAALSWLHRNTCKTLVLIFETGHQKLASQLDYASRYYRDDPAQLHSCVSPALLLLLKCLKDAGQFMESVASCEQELVDKHVVTHEQKTLSTWPLLRALLLGLNTDAVDVYLHDFLLAYYSVTEAILFSLEKKPEISVVLEQTWRRADQLQLGQRAMFWSMDRDRPHVFTLTDDRVLERQRKRDVELLRKGLKQRLPIKTEASSSGSSASLASNNNEMVAEFLTNKLMQNIEMDITPHGPGNSGFLELSFDGDMVDKKILYSRDGWSVKEVQWQGATYALKQLKQPPEEEFEWATHDSFEGESNSLKQLVLQEAQFYARIHHPNVLRVICVLQDEEKVGLLMELMDGTLDDLTLPSRRKYADLVGRGPKLTLSEKVNVMLQIAKAMEYIHSQGLIHRDLKPANVLVNKGTVSTDHDLMPCAAASGSRTFQVKVGDFGISKDNRFPLVTHTKQVGTRYFRAPEVLNNKRYSFPADVYSFAMVCFQILSGKPPPFTPESTQDLPDLRPDLHSLSDDQCPPYLKHCLEAWWHAQPHRRGCFREICRTLRHLTAALHKCQDPVRELPFLRLPEWLWNAARARANGGFIHWEDLQSLWKEELEYPYAYSKVNDILYELPLMKLLVEPWPYRDGFFLLDGSMISLKSVKLETYITAKEGGGDKIIIGGGIPDCWERFKIKQHGDTGFYSLQALRGQFVSVHSGGGARIVTASALDDSRPSERFFFTRSEDGKRVHIRANNGMYLQGKDKLNDVTADYVSSSEPGWDDGNAATFEMHQNYREWGDMMNKSMESKFSEEWSKPVAGLVQPSVSLYDGAQLFLKSVTLGTYVYSHLGGPVEMRNAQAASELGLRLMIRLHKNNICSIRSGSAEYFSAHFPGEKVIATEYFPGEWERFYITENDKRVHFQSVYSGKYLQVQGKYIIVSTSKSTPSWDNNDETFEVSFTLT